MVPSFGALNGWIDSNTTLVKVKSSWLMFARMALSNSNTTLVKVKFFIYCFKFYFFQNSNTTLVKVKSSVTNVTCKNH